ncbi:cell division control protein 48 homolog C-like [Telopea speciosissima]|uniref:cell division control protein 48 homolog C-like n=1 Tax=Telopea speciosissima TaxID=54955 RepID=UPI001CC51FDA|nr:cell division control protein 48 homolog C-like [Telopea speciosissima]
MDPAVLRPGRFGKLLYVPLPSPDEHGLILKTLSRKMSINCDVDLMAIRRMEACENLSGADLAAMMDEAAITALKEKQASGPGNSAAKPLTIKATHIEQALKNLSQSVSKQQRHYYKVLSQSFRTA